MKKLSQSKTVIFFLFVLTFCFPGRSGVLAKDKEVKKPKLIKKVIPVYPEEARKEGIKGTVDIRAFHH